jgi:hypothetical protein
MFALPNLISHVSSAAFAQARLRPGLPSAQVSSGQLRSAQVCSGLLTVNGQGTLHQILVFSMF